MGYRRIGVAIVAAAYALSVGGCLLTTSLGDLSDPSERDGSAGDSATPDAVADAAADAVGDALPPGLSIVSFTLIDATKVSTNGAVIAGFDPVAEGAVIDRAVVGSSLSFRANPTAAMIGSVQLVLNGSAIVQNSAPYSACEDNSGKWLACPLLVGANTLGARPFTGSNAAGTAGPETILHFTVK